MNRCLIVTLTLSIVFFSTSYSLPLTTSIQSAQREKELLYYRFTNNYKSNQMVAYEAAKEYLRKYSSDNDDVVKYLNKFVAAYESALARVRAPAEAQAHPDDRCYPGNQFPKEFAQSQTDLSYPSRSVEITVEDTTVRSSQAFPSVALNRYTNSFMPQDSQQLKGPKKFFIQSVENLSLISDIERARFRNNELLVVGPPATEGNGFRPDDWYVAFRALAGIHAPGVSIDPGPSPELMKVRYFGGIEHTEMGKTFFEADRTLKLMTTGFDNLTCAAWPNRPQNIATELDLISAEIGDGYNPVAGEGRWHRFWIESSEDPVKTLETNGLTVLIPKNRLVVKEESIPPGGPSRRSAREFASAISERFLDLTGKIRSFDEVQRAAAFIMLAKWMREKRIPADEDWVKGTPSQVDTPVFTPSITVLRTQRMDRMYLRYGIHGGIDFQKANRYTEASPTELRLWTFADQAQPSSSSSTWLFDAHGRTYRAIRLKITRPVYLRPKWVTWQRVVTRHLVQPRTYRSVMAVGHLVVTNDTGEMLTLELSGPENRTERMAPGNSVFQVNPGSYRLKITSKCGTTNDSATISEGERRQLRYWCTEHSATPQPTSGTGSFVVNNNTGATLTVRVGGQSYTVAPGSSSIRLPSGRHTATIITRCGTATEELDMSNGMTYSGHYTCVRR